jgi:hypothetical protein
VDVRGLRLHEECLSKVSVNVYATNHTHSQVVCNAFAKGCNGKIVPPVSLLPGPAMVYGILRGCGEIIKECEWIGRDYFYVDHGYFRRGYYDGYFRVCLNALQADVPSNLPPDRWESLDVDLRPWNRTGRHIVVCPISGYLATHLGIDPRKWTEAVVKELSRYTDRPIIVKHKDGTPLPLKDAWCLVAYTSNAAVDAIISGIPVIVLGDHPAKDLSWDWKHIESPYWPEREWWCHRLAHTQFTLDEISRGQATSLM